MTVQEIPLIGKFFKSAPDDEGVSELEFTDDPRALVTLGSIVAVEYGDGVLFGVIIEWGEPDSWGTEYFRVTGFWVGNRDGSRFEDTHWTTRQTILQVFEL